MKKFLCLFIIFFTPADLYAADYSADQKVDGLDAHGGSISTTTIIMVRDPSDTDIITTATLAEIAELISEVNITNDSDGHSLSGLESWGGLIVESGNQQTIVAESAEEGMNFCVLADGADGSAEMYVDCDSGDHFEYDGTPMANGEYIRNSSDLKGDRMCFLAIDASTWIVTYGGDTTVAEETP